MKKRLSVIGAVLAAAMLLPCSAAVCTSAQEAENTETVQNAVQVPNGYLYIEPDIPEYKAKPSEVSANCGTLPASFDSRTVRAVTPVRNQNPYGTCWAFSALAAMESSLLRTGGTSQGSKPRPNTLDLSELHFAYYFYNMQTDPLGLCEGDRNLIPRARTFLDNGGNDMFAVFALSGWVGAAAESDAPYSMAETVLKRGLPKVSASRASAHLRDAYFTVGDQTEEVKNLIYQYGAVAASYFSDNSLYTYDRANARTTYCHPSATTTNHAITLVGWDDTFPASAFANRPAGDGAFLVKNSWGSDWGTQGGYFWLSYYDSGLNHAYAVAYVAEDAAKHDYNYHYDGTGANLYASLPENGGTCGAAALFTASDADQMLEAVSIAVRDTNVTYSVQIYSAPERPTVLTSGEPLLREPVTGTTSYTGVYTVDLPEPILLKKGQTFAVVFTLQKEDGSPVSVYVDGSNDAMTWIKFESVSQEGHTFIRRTAKSWADISKYLGSGYDLRIHALTGVVPQALAGDDPGLSVSGDLLRTDGTEDADRLMSRIFVPEGFSVKLTDSVGRDLVGAVPTGAKLAVTNPSGCLAMTLVTVIPGDCNKNGILDSNDYALIRNAALSPNLLSGEAVAAASDLNGNGTVDSNDLLLLLRELLAQDAAGEAGNTAPKAA